MGVFTAPSFGGLSPTSSAFISVAALDLGIQLLGWAVSVAFRTEKLYDLFGSGTFLAVNILSFAWGGGGRGAGFPRSALAFAAVCLWAVRLGGFLFVRALRHGDSRFEAAKANPLTFLVYWLMQALWVFITMSPVVWAHTVGPAGARGLWAPDIIGLTLFVLGWVTETVADAQKSAFKSDPANRGRFIDVGVWKYARFPNYFGEICVWSGLWLLSCGSFSGAAWATVVSPLFVATLLLFVSGIPLQEKQAVDRWGGDPAYQAYRARTNLLVPLPFKILPCLK